MIDQATIDRILDAAQIVDVVSEFVTLRKRCAAVKQQEGNRLQKKQEELQNYAAKKEQELAAKQMELNGQLRDTIVAQLTTFNQTKGYQIIFSNTMGDNILLSNPAYDITAEFLEVLNKNYSSGPDDPRA